jgi:hypothetical protein
MIFLVRIIFLVNYQTTIIYTDGDTLGDNLNTETSNAADGVEDADENRPTNDGKFSKLF